MQPTLFFSLCELFCLLGWLTSGLVLGLGHPFIAIFLVFLSIIYYSMIGAYLSKYSVYPLFYRYFPKRAKAWYESDAQRGDKSKEQEELHYGN